MTEEKESFQELEKEKENSIDNTFEFNEDIEIDPDDDDDIIELMDEVIISPKPEEKIGTEIQKPTENQTTEAVQAEPETDQYDTKLNQLSRDIFSDSDDEDDDTALVDEWDEPTEKSAESTLDDELIDLFDEDDDTDLVEYMAPAFRDMLSSQYGREWWERIGEDRSTPSFYKKIQKIRTGWEIDSK